MSGFNASLQGANGALLKFEKYAKSAPGKIMRNVDISGLRIESEAKKSCTVGVSGLLRASIHYKRNEAKLEGEVDVNQSYGPFVEFGSRPHMPPIDAIKLWCLRVLGDESAAWPIAMKIKEEGTPAQPFLFPAAEHERPKYIARLKVLLGQI